MCAELKEASAVGVNDELLLLIELDVITVVVGVGEESDLKEVRVALLSDEDIAPAPTTEVFNRGKVVSDAQSCVTGLLLVLRLMGR
jgi:hypothetical protein